MKLSALTILLLLIVSGAFWGYSYFTSSALLSIESVPESIVYVNGEQKGKTPIELELRDSRALIKLIPDNFSQELSVYESDVKLTPNVKTIMRHVFDSSASLSQTEIISFEKKPSESASIAVVTIPDGVRVRIDNKEQGVSPVKVDKLLSGRHKVEVSANGYKTRSFDVQAIDGYLLTSFIDLSQDLSYQSDQNILSVLSSESIKEETVEVSKDNFVTILDTPTGFLRVRSKPGIDGKELGEVKPGEQYKLKSFSAEEGWYEIEYASASGWITSKYASESAKLQN